MNMREMDSMERMKFWHMLETATRYAHGIDTLMDAKMYAESKDMLVRMIASRETILRSKLAQIASMLGLALVDKAVLAEGEVRT